MAARILLAVTAGMVLAAPALAEHRIRPIPAVPVVAAPAPVVVVPRADRSLTYAVQHELAWAGYDPGPPDGLFGPRTSYAIRAYQHHHGLPPDGLVSVALLDHLRARRAATAAAGNAPVAAEAPVCREFQQTAKIGGQDVTTVGNACLQKDGSWKTVN